MSVSEELVGPIVEPRQGPGKIVVMFRSSFCRLAQCSVVHRQHSRNIMRRPAARPVTRSHDGRQNRFRGRSRHHDAASFFDALSE